MNRQVDFSYLDQINTSSHVLIAPLNWGLGHATRCIPIINKLIERGNKVTIASDGVALDLLRKEFPKLTSLELPSYKVNYKRDFLIGLMLQAPKIALAMSQEYRTTQAIVDQHHVDIIISDNRYGVRSNKVKSIVLIHQINILLNNTVVQWCGRRVNKYLINRFDQCWVPDDIDQRLAGQLSDVAGVDKAQYIGVLSRMTSDPSIKIIYDVCIILSGPEPKRSELEVSLLTLMGESDYRIKLIRGTTDPLIWQSKLITLDVTDMATADEINIAINKSKVIVTRSGYTTLMDLQSFDKKVIMIPTQGQTEQEYLADRLKPPYYKIEEKDLQSDLLQRIESIS